MGVAVPIFLLYSLSAFGAALVSVLRPLPPHPSADGLLRALRAGAVGGLFLLAFGTGCDNARTVAGAFAMNVPDGVFELRNSTEAQRLIDQRGGVVDANYLISWFCFGAHEIFGGSFVLPGVYLWAVAASLPAKPDGARCQGLLAHLQSGRVLAALAVALAALGMGVGGAGFAQHTATSRLQLEWNPALEVYSWGSGDENPSGLFGVFLSSGVWVVVGVLLLLSRGNRWFLAVQLLALVGQGLGGALGGDWLQVPSNACEQLVTWALVLLGWELQREAAAGGGSQGGSSPLLKSESA